ncbi:lipoprotein insertase outer membrane protein LolB [Luteimonas sp. 100069]|uniref:lipoprotein insertase outer membrane protein LolB n=1 Tax=Luteimonas sp. 100069 TaxID=2006109 RepID=UPI000F4E815C|nr:lipoprotein insertase outer membrane protein LolB [Luteimonas sp. 100069]RPD84348.1 outer membrane lipoprotein LolB [Luteimonas sp. 100069]
MRPRIAWVALLAIALSACTSVPVRAPLQTVELDADSQAQAQARLAAREAAVRAMPAFGFTGRVAMSNGRDGGSGRIEWVQTGADYHVTLSAPVTRQSWELRGGPGGARIEGLEGGPRAGADVGALLWQATGFEIPVAALAAWAAGTRAPEAIAGTAELGFDAGGQLARLQQDGWTIDYLEWQPEPGNAAVALPTRINAQRGDARVRLIVDAWSADAAMPAP